jgi:ketosteroid isomerase-like protein
MKDAERQHVVIAIEAAMRSFAEAERARDAAALIAHFAPVPEFHVYNDGDRLTYESMVAGLRATFPTLKAIEGGFSDLNVLVLAPDAALATATFREVITDAAGQTARVRGAATWLWRSIDGKWRITYGQADHYPDGEPQRSAP